MFSQFLAPNLCLSLRRETLTHTHNTYTDGRTIVCEVPVPVFGYEPAK